MQISLKWTYNGHPLPGQPPPCNARTRKQYVQGGASLPEPPLFTCSDPPKITNIARTCAAQQARTVCSLRQAASTDTASQNRTPRTLATLQQHQTRLQGGMQCCELRNDDRHDPHTRGVFAPPGPWFLCSGLRASASPALGGKARFVDPPVWWCGSYIPIPVVLADLNVGHAAREAWRRDLCKQ